MELIAHILCLVAALWIAGCGSAAQSGLSPARAAQTLIANEPVSQLLDFESSSDVVFVNTPSVTPRLDSSHAHAGQSSLALEPSTKLIYINLPTLLRGRDFPGQWTLIGAFFYCEQPATLSIYYFQDRQLLSQRAVNLIPNQWTPLFTDIARLGAGAGAGAGVSTENSSLVFQFHAPLTSTVWCDDVSLMNNTQVFLQGASWTLHRSGDSYIGEKPGRFSFKLLAADADPQGWAMTEISPLRACFISAGPQKSLTIYRDGRSYWGAQFRALAHGPADAVFEAQHQKPADISISAEHGRLNRATPGDANNDGYNESTGSYQVLANSRQLDLTISPRTSILAWPVLEISNLPPGEAIITVEGRLIDDIAHLPNGNLLVILPLELDRPTAVSIRVQ
jgi:hypothetical protein